MTEYTVVVIGGASVGKTALTVSLTTGKFDTEYNPTIGKFTFSQPRGPIHKGTEN